MGLSSFLDHLFAGWRLSNSVAVIFLVIGTTNWYWPGFDGIFSASLEISAGDGRIIGSIFQVGAAILWFMPTCTDD